MLKEALASNAVKLVAACVCPIAGTAALTVSVPKMRSAVHRMTAPPARADRVKPRVRKAKPAAAAKTNPDVICAEPVVLTGAPFIPVDPAALKAPVRDGAFGDDGATGGGRSRVEGMLSAAAGGAFGGSGGGGFAPVQPGPDKEQPGVDVPGESGGTEPAGPPTAVLPEPATWVQMIAGFALLGVVLRRGVAARVRRAVRR